MRKNRMALMRLLIVPTAMALAPNVHAGGAVDDPAKDVQINGNFASGAIHTTRFASSISKKGKAIGCVVHASAYVSDSLPGGVSVTCTATYTIGAQVTQLQCNSYDDRLVAVAEGINDDSYVTFEMAPNTDCLSISVEGSSTHLQVPHD